MGSLDNLASSPVPIFPASREARASPYAGKRGTGDEATDNCGGRR